MSTFTQNRTEQIKAVLVALGADQYDMWLPETHRLAMIIHANEQILGVVYGHYIQASAKITGRGALVATTDRVMLLDKKPMFEKCDEMSYGVISAVSYTKAGIAGTVVLHTRMGDISVRTLNKTCAQSFVEAIESKIFVKERSDV
jgi:hypothetical protein